MHFPKDRITAKILVPDGIRFNDEHGPFHVKVRSYLKHVVQFIRLEVTIFLSLPPCPELTKTDWKINSLPFRTICVYTQASDGVRIVYGFISVSNFICVICVMLSPLFIAKNNINHTNCERLSH